MAAIPTGRFVWYDLMTSDPRAAQRFYAEVAGWGTQAWDGPIPYTIWTADGTPHGGVMQLPPDAQSAPHWLAYISTPDIDATVAWAQKLGASVLVKPTEIPDVGQFAVLRDPQGASFAVYTPARDESRHDAAPRIGEFSWHELATTDSNAAFAFYAAIFGWKSMGAFDMGGGSMYREYGCDGRELGGIYTKPAQIPGPPMWLHYIMVDDVDTAADAVTDAGGRILSGPMDVPGGDRIAQCVDPQGAMFAIHAKAKAA